MAIRRDESRKPIDIASEVVSWRSMARGERARGNHLDAYEMDRASDSARDELEEATGSREVSQFYNPQEDVNWDGEG